MISGQGWRRRVSCEENATEHDHSSKPPLGYTGEEHSSSLPTHSEKLPHFLSRVERITSLGFLAEQLNARPFCMLIIILSGIWCNFTCLVIFHPWIFPLSLSLSQSSSSNHGYHGGHMGQQGSGGHRHRPQGPPPTFSSTTSTFHHRPGQRY